MTKTEEARTNEISVYRNSPYQNANDLAITRVKAEQAATSAEEAHSRIDGILLKGMQ